MLRRVFATQGVAPGRRRLATRQAILLRDFVLKGRTEPSGSVVTVSAGYLRNFMFPRQIAIPATRANLADYTSGYVQPGHLPPPYRSDRRP